MRGTPFLGACARKKNAPESASENIVKHGLELAPRMHEENGCRIDIDLLRRIAAVPELEPPVNVRPDGSRKIEILADIVSSAHHKIHHVVADRTLRASIRF